MLLATDIINNFVMGTVKSMLLNIPTPLLLNTALVKNFRGKLCRSSVAC